MYTNIDNKTKGELQYYHNHTQLCNPTCGPAHTFWINCVYGLSLGSFCYVDSKLGFYIKLYSTSLVCAPPPQLLGLNL